jgi:hypothetical protein
VPQLNPLVEWLQYKEQIRLLRELPYRLLSELRDACASSDPKLLSSGQPQPWAGSFVRPCAAVRLRVAHGPSITATHESDHHTGAAAGNRVVGRGGAAAAQNSLARPIGGPREQPGSAIARVRAVLETLDRVTHIAGHNNSSRIPEEQLGVLTAEVYAFMQPGPCHRCDGWACTSSCTTRQADRCH